MVNILWLLDAGQYVVKCMPCSLSRYRDTSEWKPFHHDAAAMKVNILKIMWKRFFIIDDHLNFESQVILNSVILTVLQPDKARTQNFTVAVSFGCERYSSILRLPLRTN